jgi:hypothetical protein
MRVYLFGALLALTLGGCTTLSTIEGTSVPAKAAYTAAAAANTAIQGATVYLRLPLCSTAQPKACRTQATSQQLYDDMTAVQTSRNGLIALLKQNNGGPIPVANYNNLQTAVQTLTVALQQAQAK